VETASRLGVVHQVAATRIIIAGPIALQIIMVLVPPSSKTRMEKKWATETVVMM
jgi:hypothetical protein